MLVVRCLEPRRYFIRRPKFDRVWCVATLIADVDAADRLKAVVWDVLVAKLLLGFLY